MSQANRTINKLTAIRIYACPACFLHYDTALDAIHCWYIDDPYVFDRYNRDVIAEKIGCTGPRVSQIIRKIYGPRKTTVAKEQ